MIPLLESYEKEYEFEFSSKIVKKQKINKYLNDLFTKTASSTRNSEN